MDAIKNSFEPTQLNAYEVAERSVAREHVVQPVGNLAIKGVLEPTSLAIRDLTEAANLKQKRMRLDTIAASISYIRNLQSNQG